MTQAGSPTTDSDSRAQFWLVAALTFASVLLLGYGFGEVNHHEQLPLVLRALDPDYLRADWVVNANQGFNHRSIYTALMAFFARITGVEAAFFGVYLASLLAWTLGIAALVRSLWPGGEQTAPVLAPLLLLFCAWGTISNTLIFDNLVPALPALALSVWFGVMLRREKFALAAVFLLAAGLIHAQIGPISGAFLLIAQAYALDSPARRRLLHPWPLWIFAIALPLALALISNDKRALNAAQNREALDVLTYLRHPHHYIPQSWSRDAWWGEIAWLALVLVARHIARPSRFLDGLILAALVFCASGFLPFLVDSWFPLVKLQHFRMTIWLQIAGSLYLSQVAATWWQEEIPARRIAGAWVFAALLMPLVANSPGLYRLILPLGLLLFHVAARRAPYPALLLPWLPWWVSGRADSSHFALKIVSTALFALLTLAVLGLWQRRPQFALRLSRSAAALGALALLALFLRPPRGKLARLNRVQTRLAYEKPDGPMEAWVKTNTDSNAVFLIPPTLETFRLKANRAVLADFKVFPWSDAGLLDWRRRIDALVGGPLPLNQYQPAVLNARYAHLTAAQIELLARQYGAAYLVTMAPAQDNLKNFSLIYRDEKWQIYRLQ